MSSEQRQEIPTSRPLAHAIALAGGVFAALLRVAPHPPNFSAVGGLGLFGGARLRGWQAYLLPLGIMILSDLVLWVVSGFDIQYSLADLSRIPVYTGFMIYVLIGRCIQGTNSLVSVSLAATIGGLQFFIVTNFFHWLLLPMQPYYDQLPEVWRYSRDWEGLVKCFAMALGFYQQETPVESYPFMVVTNFPGALLFWTMFGDALFTSVYVLAHVKLRRFVENPGHAAGIKEGEPPLVSTDVQQCLGSRS